MQKVCTDSICFIKFVKILLGNNFPIFNRLRAQFGTDTMKNAVHGSSSVAKAEKVIKEFLPEVEILPDGTVRGL